jgi:NADH-quinone oxidoreductase subunit L
VPESNSLAHFLAPVVVQLPHHVALSTELGLATLATAVSAAGVFLAWLLYVSRPELPARIRERIGGLHRLVANTYYVDEIYDALIVRPMVVLSDRVLYRGVDAGVIDGLAINGSARSVRGFASYVLKYAHGGLAQSYLITMVVGTLAVLAWLLRG